MSLTEHPTHIMPISSSDVVQHPHFGPAMPGLNWVPAPRYLMRRDRVFRHLTDIEPCRVIDIGCGPATQLSELAQRGFEAYGVDRSDQALDLARNFSNPQNPMILRAELDPTWRGRFDLALSFEVIEHLDEDVAAMAEWREYLKLGGLIMISTRAHPSRWNAADVWAGHVRRYTRNGLKEAVTGAGWTCRAFVPPQVLV
ncbi:class I SAM-dependent methyltransferase [Sulfitobacter geojensis]|uniref:class I SAM-dependent methyltransferase n=1 Tax=Sulfitobacter geojensis TaxID=1342299 RepID=UPI0036DE9F48